MNDHDQLDRETLTNLAGHGGSESDSDRGPHVSLYAPMFKAGPDTRQNPIRYKNLLREARQALESWELSAAQGDELLAPLESKIDDYEFWQHQEIGLAVFACAEFAASFRLPIEFGELCTVTDRFHLKPLFPLLSGDGRFHLLALSQNAVRLLECSRHSVREIELGDEVPRSLADALGHELTEQHLQFRTTSRDEAIYHAQGAGEDDVKAEIAKFLGMLDEGVRQKTHADGGSAAPPLVLAAVEELAAMYRDKSGHKRILDEVVAGNPEHQSAESLQEAAWALVEPHFDKDRQEHVERFGQAKADGSGSSELGEVVIAADEGRVDTLFVARGIRRWGRVHTDERKVSEDDSHESGNEDLLDRAAVSTWRNGGTVYAVEPDSVPDEGTLAAIYRY